MRPSAAQLQRVATLLAKRLVAADVLTLDVPEEAVQARFAALLARNFEEEAEIEREAAAEAERVVRRGAPGVRREELDLRRVEQLVKQRIAELRANPADPDATPMQLKGGTLTYDLAPALRKAGIPF